VAQESLNDKSSEQPVKIFAVKVARESTRINATTGKPGADPLASICVIGGSNFACQSWRNLSSLGAV
jgi:hypothetical protein